jgi:hypothetical protein
MALGYVTKTVSTSYFRSTLFGIRFYLTRRLNGILLQARSSFDKGDEPLNTDNE